MQALFCLQPCYNDAMKRLLSLTAFVLAVGAVNLFPLQTALALGHKLGM